MKQTPTSYTNAKQLQFLHSVHWILGYKEILIAKRKTHIHIKKVMQMISMGHTKC